MNKDIFQQIIDRDIDAKIIYEDDRVISFYDINPVSKGHFLTVPKKHSRNLIDIDADTLNYLIATARRLAVDEIKRKGVAGYRLVVNSEPSAKQVIFRTHVHILPARVGDDEWLDLERGKGVY